MYYFFKVYHENLTKFRLFFQIDKIIKIVVQFDEQITLPFFFDPKLNLRPSTAKYYFPPKVTKPTIWISVFNKKAVRCTGTANMLNLVT